MENHIPVLLRESIEILNIKNNGIYIDCTLGRGGHSMEILKLINNNGFLYSIDQDDDAILYSEKKLSKIGENYKILKGNFVNIKSLLNFNGVKKVDGILYDLGVSSPQLDQDNRGFSYRTDSYLDMRMDKENLTTAHKIVNEFSKEELINILFEYGDEKFSRSIVNNIIEYRNLKPINTTFELVEVIKKSLPQKVLKQKKHPAKKTFQAIRIAVNNELNVLKNSLKQATELLNLNSRIAIITFHSLEEKIVKNFFKELTFSESDLLFKKLPISNPETKSYKIITKKPIKPTKEEILNNRRAHSAKLWVIEKIK